MNPLQISMLCSACAVLLFWVGVYIARNWESEQFMPGMSLLTALVFMASHFVLIASVITAIVKGLQ